MATFPGYAHGAPPPRFDSRVVDAQGSPQSLGQRKVQEWMVNQRIKDQKVMNVRGQPQFTELRMNQQSSGNIQDREQRMIDHVTAEQHLNGQKIAQQSMGEQIVMKGGLVQQVTEHQQSLDPRLTQRSLSHPRDQRLIEQAMGNLQLTDRRRQPSPSPQVVQQSASQHQYMQQHQSQQSAGQHQFVQRSQQSSSQGQFFQHHQSQQSATQQQFVQQSQQSATQQQFVQQSQQSASQQQFIQQHPSQQQVFHHSQSQHSASQHHQVLQQGQHQPQLVQQSRNQQAGSQRLILRQSPSPQSSSSSSQSPSQQWRNEQRVSTPVIVDQQIREPQGAEKWTGQLKRDDQRLIQQRAVDHLLEQHRYREMSEERLLVTNKPKIMPRSRSESPGAQQWTIHRKVRERQARGELGSESEGQKYTIHRGMKDSPQSFRKLSRPSSVPRETEAEVMKDNQQVVRRSHQDSTSDQDSVFSEPWGMGPRTSSDWDGQHWVTDQKVGGKRTTTYYHTSTVVHEPPTTKAGIPLSRKVSVGNMTVMSLECHGILNHWLLDCLFNS